MKVAIASGKGGTGKTTVSSALTTVWDTPVIAVDLDVEEPNLHLFLRPNIQGQRKAFMEVPAVDEEKCTFCRACADLCQFKAISVLANVVLTFTEMCHGCGGCMAVCPEKIISLTQRELGDVVWGRADKAGFLMGRLRVGEAMSPPLMREVKITLDDLLATSPADVIIDAPPGVSCPAVNAVMDADVIVLVSEPTPFGLYDLELAVEAFLPLKKPLGVVINRSGIGTDAVMRFCRSNQLPIWGEIPYTEDIATAYSKGRIVSTVSPEIKDHFIRLMGEIRRSQLSHQRVCHA
jgi:MinD superfamily P-loop ATPase